MNQKDLATSKCQLLRSILATIPHNVLLTDSIPWVKVDLKAVARLWLSSQKLVWTRLFQRWVNQGDESASVNNDSDE